MACHTSEPDFQLPDGLTVRRAREALSLILETSGPGARFERRVTRADWERLQGSWRNPATVRRSWERAKADLAKLGAPVRSERDGRRVELILLPGAWEYAHETLDAITRAYPPKPRKPLQLPPLETATDRRELARVERREKVRRARLYGQLSIREIAQQLDVSVGTVHADLKALRLSGTWERIHPDWNAPEECLEALREGVRQVVQDASGHGVRARAEALSKLAEALAERQQPEADPWDDWDETDVALPELDYDDLDERSWSA